jgi:hypothetical protein
MSNNIYAAPQSNLDERVQSEFDDRFYVVSIRKMMILTIATGGLYLLFWNFKHWSNYRHVTGESIWPLPRAIFAILFTHSLFHKIEDHDVTGNRPAWSGDRIATPIVLIYIANYVLSWVGSGSRVVSLINTLAIIPIAFLMKSVQAEANARCGDPSGSSNDNLTGANIGWCVVGCLIWLFAFVGILAPR